MRREVGARGSGGEDRGHREEQLVQRNLRQAGGGRREGGER